LVGRAVLQRAVGRSRHVFVVGLRRSEVEETLSLFSKNPRPKRHPVLGEYLLAGKVAGFWGDIFLSIKMKDVSRREINEDESVRMTVIEDLLGLVRGRKRKRQNFLRALLKYLKPDVVVDTVNTATAIAYRDVFQNAGEIYRKLKEDESVSVEDLRFAVENLLLSLNIPILLTHVMNLQQGLKEAGTKIYLKVGTTGTGGMGWNIPYTHGEDKPSKKLLDKSAIAGASTMLFVLMNRDDTPTVVKEIKPGAMIGWKRIGKGQIRDITLREPAKVSLSLGEIPEVRTEDTGVALETAYIDTGENGLFSLEEFRAITSLDQMEMVTPEDIAEIVFLEIEGKSTGRDVVGAVEGAILGPSYRGGFMREDAIALLEKYEKDSPMPSVAFEILGPPRLSKLLFEAHILRKAFGTFTKLSEASAEEISEAMWKVLTEDPQLMRYITSVGIGILSPDGNLYYTENLKVPKPPVEIPSEEDIDVWAHKGWVDTRTENARRWKFRAMIYLDELHRKQRGLKRLEGSSAYDRIGIGRRSLRVDDKIVPGDIVRWIFIHEDKGRRTRPY